MAKVAKFATFLHARQAQVNACREPAILPGLYGEFPDFRQLSCPARHHTRFTSCGMLSRIPAGVISINSALSCSSWMVKAPP